ncbi:T7 tail tubular protein A [Desulfovibrio oxyclinae]|uniref:T7 tail tubular protein A n=1 Tax=Desulfovibrio oxyclinae TaxID=63560 RepID=UPI00035C4B59|nr:T7 tail tubular protein A [Desulfovibrio oxyclinae]
MLRNTPTTELEAVNTILSTIGETPVSSLGDSLTTDAVVAQNILHEVSNEMQTEGWHFNTEVEYPLVPDLATKNIMLPQNCVNVDLDPLQYPDRDVVVRGKRLYDRRKHTYEFNETLYAEVILLLPFEEMPEAARRYATIRAARIFQDRVVGSDTLHAFNEVDEIKARSILVDSQSENADSNVFTGASGILSNWSVGQVLTR